MNETTKDGKLMQEAIEKMAIIAEHGLPNVKYHIQRMREYARLLALGVDKNEAEADQISLACMLHDVGMVSVPATITSKAGNLSNEEWEIVKQHPIVGADLLADPQNGIFQLAKIVTISHHERWDGSGYPHGLKGGDIPLVGRICGLCDVFDTLTHARAYKSAMPPDEVLLLIQESNETFFDPALVDAFTLNYKEIIEIKEKYASPALLENE